MRHLILVKVSCALLCVVKVMSECLQHSMKTAIVTIALDRNDKRLGEGLKN